MCCVHLLVLLAMSCQASSPAPPHLTFAVSPAARARWQWTLKPWATVGDARVQALRKAMEAQYGFAMPKIPDTTVDNYKRSSQQAPQDRDKLFRWGCAAYLQCLRNPASTDSALLTALDADKQSASFEFMRLRYLVEVSQNTMNDYLTALGERLAAADAKDLYVRYYLSHNISTETAEGRLRSMRYATEMVQIAPDQAVGYGCVASVHAMRWLGGHRTDMDAARQAVHWYQEYLKRATHPSQAEDRQGVQKAIDLFNGWIAKAEKAR